MAKATGKDEGLKRLGGGRWQTRDERFSVEPQSGTWVLVDAEQTDDLGLPLVRGPFGTLTAAKAAIEAAREGVAPASPLADRVANLRERPATKPDRGDAAAKAKAAKPKAEPEPPAEPRWIVALEPAERRRAKRLIELLSETGAPDPEGIVRRDLVGGVATVAGFAVDRALVELGADASPSKVAQLLADGRDEALGVRWRLVDDDDRPITLDS